MVLLMKYKNHDTNIIVARAFALARPSVKKYSSALQQWSYDQELVGLALQQANPDFDREEFNHVCYS